ncbi:MAG TPA: PAS domain S-box protein, partial [Polyangiaceae bacterium]|nr:PAS domain S-box protein [Polyangiaceae bacterium]
MREAEAELLATVIAALDGDVPGTCLEEAIHALWAQGLADPDGASEPWLELERGKGKLRLVAAPGVEPPSPRVRAILAHALGTALTRATERDEARVVIERHELLRAASFEGILIHDGGSVVDGNDRLCEMSGYSREEVFQPGHMLRVVAPEDLPAVQERIRQRIEGEFESTIVRKDGSRMRVEFCTKQTQLGDRPLRVVAIRDITERERTAKLLQESEARLRTLLEATFDGVAFTRNGVFVDVSESMERFLGFPREKFIGRPVIELVAPGSREEVARRIQQKIPGAYEAVTVGVDGEVPVMVVSVMSTLDGEPVRVTALRDLRETRRLEQERRQLERQVERSQRLESLGVLASGIAHDFNNLLVGVLGGAETLLGTLKDADDRTQAEAIHTAGHRAAGLTKQMLAYAGQRSLTTTAPVDLAELWQELCKLLDAALSKKAQVELELAPDSVVLGEHSALMQVFMNLLTNASDSLEDRPGRISVTTARVREPGEAWDRALGGPLQPGSWVLVQVRDTGAGMDEATQGRIFEPFFSTKPGGHGLGLGSCLGIVRAHGGAIRVDSAPGLGSTFSVLLPATELRSEPPARTATTAPPCRVLVVDDEPLVRSHLRRVLTRDGFTVQEAHDASTGLEAIQQSPPDVVILDMMLPDLDGVDVVRRLRASGVTVPVVLCSGNLDAAWKRGLDPKLVQGMLQ